MKKWKGTEDWIYLITLVALGSHQVSIENWKGLLITGAIVLLVSIRIMVRSRRRGQS